MRTYDDVSTNPITNILIHTAGRSCDVIRLHTHLVISPIKTTHTRSRGTSSLLQQPHLFFIVAPRAVLLVVVFVGGGGGPPPPPPTKAGSSSRRNYIHIEGRVWRGGGKRVFAFFWWVVRLQQRQRRRRLLLLLHLLPFISFVSKNYILVYYILYITLVIKSWLYSL